jgi:hypothetical protein
LGFGTDMKKHPPRIGKGAVAEWQLDCLRWVGILWYGFETVSFEYSVTDHGAVRDVPANGPSRPYATRLASETV